MLGFLILVYFFSINDDTSVIKKKLFNSTKNVLFKGYPIDDFQEPYYLTRDYLFLLNKVNYSSDKRRVFSNRRRIFLSIIISFELSSYFILIRILSLILPFTIPFIVSGFILYILKKAIKNKSK